jgi:hypothetical protein
MYPEEMSVRELLRTLRDADRPLAYLELQKDIVFPHLSPLARLKYIDHALEAGRRQAALYKGTDVFHLAKSLNVKIVVQSTRHGAANTRGGAAAVLPRADYDAVARTITLYKPSLDQMNELLSALPPRPWSMAQVMDLHAAHELFHHLEASCIVPVHEQLPPVPTFRLGPVCITRARARQCREIAAHAFAKDWLDLPFLPAAVDWLLLIAHRQWTTSGLQMALDEAKRACHGQS